MRKRLESAGVKRKDSVAEILLMKHFGELGIHYQREWRFTPLRKWRFDFAFNETKTLPVYGGARLFAVEIEGGNEGTYDRFGRWQRGKQGAHNRPKGFEKDIRKYNEAAKLGWTVIRFTPNMIERAEDKAFLAELFGRSA